jgi:hypothetical protein
VEEAAATAVESLLVQLERDELSPANVLRLTVDGVNYQQLAILKKMLQRDFAEIADVQTRGFSGDIARLDLTLLAPVVSFAESLAARDFGSFRLRVLSQSSSKLDTTVVMR